MLTTTIRLLEVRLKILKLCENISSTHEADCWSNNDCFHDELFFHQSTHNCLGSTVPRSLRDPNLEVTLPAWHRAKKNASNKYLLRPVITTTSYIYLFFWNNNKPSHGRKICDFWKNPGGIHVLGHFCWSRSWSDEISTTLLSGHCLARPKIDLQSNLLAPNKKPFPNFWAQCHLRSAASICRSLIHHAQ